MSTKWYFLPIQLQRIAEYNPDSAESVRSIGDPIGGSDVIEDFITKDIVEMRRNGFVPTLYTHVYRVRNEDGSTAYYMATGNDVIMPLFNPPMEP